MPVHEHDCEDCVFLGTRPHPEKATLQLDHYYCPLHGGGLVARYSSDGPDYSAADVARFKRLMWGYGTPLDTTFKLWQERERRKREICPEKPPFHREVK